MNTQPSTPLADAVFLIVLLLAFALAVIGALAWDRLNERQRRRAAEPHSVEHKQGSWN